MFDTLCGFAEYRGSFTVLWVLYENSGCLLAERMAVLLKM